jgi:hypothetical protein
VVLDVRALEAAACAELVGWATFLKTSYAPGESDKEVSLMYARVALFEGADPGRIDENLDAIRQRSESGPPEGVPAKQFLVLTDRSSGKLMAITLFETEEDRRTGDETLNTMSPPVGEGMGRRTGVEMYEVPIHMTA